MEKAAVTGTKSAGNRWEIVATRTCAVAVLACLGASCWAQQAGPTWGDVVVAEARTEPMRLDVQTSTLPRRDVQDTGFQAPRVDFSLLPAGGSGIGPVVGMSGFSQRGVRPLGLQPVKPSVDLGLRWSQRVSHKQLDITAWRRMTNDDDALSLIQANQQPVYGARIEMNLNATTRKTGLALERGFVGLQLDSGAKITIRRKNGGPMVYYRTTF